MRANVVLFTVRTGIDHTSSQHVRPCVPPTARTWQEEDSIGVSGVERTEPDWVTPALAGPLRLDHTALDWPGKGASCYGPPAAHQPPLVLGRIFPCAGPRIGRW